MMSAGRLLHASGRRCSPCHELLLRHPWTQACRYGELPHVITGQHYRRMSIFQEFSKRFKGEIQHNPELQKSIKELKEKAGDFRHKTIKTTEQIYKHVETTQKEAGVKASQASALVRQKVHEAKEKVSEATTQVKETVGSFKTSDSQCAKEPLKNANVKASESAEGDSFSAKGTNNQRACESEQNTTFIQSLSNGFNAISVPVSFLFEKVRRTKLADLAKSGCNFFIEELTTSSSKKAKSKLSAQSNAPRSSSTDIVPVFKKKSAWDNIKEKFQSHPVYRRFRGVKEHPIVVKSQEIAEDLRERWETSDSPVVHKIQDLNDSIFGETAPAIALKEIRQRDPTFTFPDFLDEVQESLRPVLQAYMKGDLLELQKRCSREVVDRCRAERRAYESQGIFFDNKILHVSDVELRETKLLGNVPIIIVSFQTQQIYCVRDKNGKITQGAKDDIQTVFYAWAMQQLVNEDLEEGEIFPRWQLREMQLLGIRAII